jgi:hypothetical protein
VRPAGIASTSATPVVALGPAFLSVTVNVTTSVTFGVALSTTFVTMRSAPTDEIAVEVLLAGFGSVVVVVTVATFVIWLGVV